MSAGAEKMSADPEKIRAIVAAALRDAGDDSPFADDDSLVVTDRLSSDALKASFDPAWYLRHVDAIFRRAGLA